DERHIGQHPVVFVVGERHVAKLDLPPELSEATRRGRIDDLATRQAHGKYARTTPSPAAAWCTAPPARGSASRTAACIAGRRRASRASARPVPPGPRRTR